MVENKGSPIKRRREREREAVRHAILAAAREIAAQEHWQAVTIRRIADRIEYSPPTIYEHFQNKDAILLELMREGFILLRPALEAARIASPEPQAQLLRMAEAYWNFAWDNAELYQVMHGLGGVTFCAPDVPAVNKPIEAEAVFAVVVAAIHDLVQSDQARIADTKAAAEVAWATLHGLIALTMGGRIEGGREHGAELAQRAMSYLISAWQTGT